MTNKPVTPAAQRKIDCGCRKGKFACREHAHPAALECNCEMGEGELHTIECAVMEQPAHTPIPWEVTPTLGRIAITKPHKTVGLAGVHIASIENGVHIDDHEANAKLICRAVNSHSELLGLVKQQLNCFKELSDDMLTDSDSQWVKDAERAVKQAEGK